MSLLRNTTCLEVSKKLKGMPQGKKKTVCTLLEYLNYSVIVQIQLMLILQIPT